MLPVNTSPPYLRGVLFCNCFSSSAFLTFPGACRHAPASLRFVSTTRQRDCPLTCHRGTETAVSRADRQGGGRGRGVGGCTLRALSNLGSENRSYQRDIRTWMAENGRLFATGTLWYQTLSPLHFQASVCECAVVLLGRGLGLWGGWRLLEDEMKLCEMWWSSFNLTTLCGSHRESGKLVSSITRKSDYTTCN